jgi:hypothetical protein
MTCLDSKYLNSPDKIGNFMEKKNQIVSRTSYISSCILGWLMLWNIQDFELLSKYSWNIYISGTLSFLENKRTKKSLTFDGINER